MVTQSKNDIHEAGVHYSCYMLAKFGFGKIENNKDSPHVIAQKDGKTYSFHINANSEEDAWATSEDTDFKFTHLVVLTFTFKDPNVYILRKEDVKDMIEPKEGKNKYWLNIDKIRHKGKHWNQI